MTHQVEDPEEWSTAAIMDQLIYELSSANTFNIDSKNGQIRIDHKYLDRAEFFIASTYGIPRRLQSMLLTVLTLVDHYRMYCRI